VNNPDDPLFFVIDRGTNSELVINLYKLLDLGVVLVEHNALEGPFGGGTGAVALDDLTDVDVSAPNDLDVLTFDVDSGKWVAAAPTGGAAVTEVGDLLFWGIL
jgi:hypothetical protein